MSKLIYQHLTRHKLFNKSVKFGLKRIKLALNLLGNPERKLNNVISVLGESGKFTTLWSLKNFIEANNQTVSTYTSPSIFDIRDRYFMGKGYLSYKEIKETIKKIEKLKIPLTVYEVLTLVYVINASKLNVDYFIIETGALWKNDCSNIFSFPLARPRTPHSRPPPPTKSANPRCATAGDRPPRERAPGRKRENSRSLSEQPPPGRRPFATPPGATCPALARQGISGAI